MSLEQLLFDKIISVVVKNNDNDEKYVNICYLKFVIFLSQLKILF